MQTLVIYDSIYGNTKKIAESIAESLDGKAVKIDEVNIHDLHNLDLLVIGCPTQAWSTSPAMKQFLKNLREVDLSGINAAAFDTGFGKWYAGSGANGINDALKQMQCTIIIKPKQFVVLDKEGPLRDGEIEAAQNWVNEIKQSIFI